MRQFAVCAAALMLWLMGSLAHAEDPKTFEAWWTQATTHQGAKITEQPDFTMVTWEDADTLFYFTKPSHPAHPGVIKRSLVPKADGIYVDMHGVSFASDDKQDAFKAWLAQFSELNQRMAAELQGPSRESRAYLKSHPDLALASRCSTLADEMSGIMTEMAKAGRLGPADLAYVPALEKLAVVAHQDLDTLAGSASFEGRRRADAKSIAMEEIAEARGGSEKIARDCWAHYKIEAPRR